MSPTPQLAQRQRRTLIMAALAVVVVLAPAMAAAQLQTEAPLPVPGAKPVIVERIKVHGAALERNLEGNAADRDVLVFLPPSYAKDTSRRYPVVYACDLVNTFEIYPGTHTSKVADRFQHHALPFFSRTLCAERACR